MLVLSRKPGESIVLPSCGVTLTVVSVNGTRVKLGVQAPYETPVHRGEIAKRIASEEPRPQQTAAVY
jgi:carbon storage regulator